MPPFESCLFAQSSPLSGVLVTQVLADAVGNAQFNFDSVFGSISEPLSGFGLYYPSVGWVDALIVVDAPESRDWFVVTGLIEERPTSWRAVPPIGGVAWEEGKELSSLQSGVTVQWVR